MRASSYRPSAPRLQSAGNRRRMGTLLFKRSHPSPPRGDRPDHRPLDRWSPLLESRHLYEVLSFGHVQRLVKVGLPAFVNDTIVRRRVQGTSQVLLSTTPVASRSSKGSRERRDEAQRKMRYGRRAGDRSRDETPTTLAASHVAGTNIRVEEGYPHEVHVRSQNHQAAPKRKKRDGLRRPPVQSQFGFAIKLQRIATRLLPSKRP
jgi:hypothetical protein